MEEHLESSEIQIYQDWENSKDLIGKAKLLRLISKGLPYIIDDAKTPINDQLVFRADTWLVKFIDSSNKQFITDKEYTMKVRMLHSIGPTNSLEPVEDLPNPLVDKFLVFNGIEIY